jgi:hypothetical protein
MDLNQQLSVRLANQVLSQLQIKPNNKLADKSVNKHVKKSVDNHTPSPPKIPTPRIISTNLQLILKGFFNIVHKIQTRRRHKPSVSLSKAAKLLCITLSLSLTKTSNYDQKTHAKRKRKNKVVNMSLMVGLLRLLKA